MERPSHPLRLIGGYVRGLVFMPRNSLVFQGLWNTYGECENYGVMTGHTGAVTEISWNHDGRYEASVERLVTSAMQQNLLRFH